MSQKVLPAGENAVPEAREGRPEVFIDPKTPSRFPFYFFSKANWWFFFFFFKSATAKVQQDCCAFFTRRGASISAALGEEKALLLHVCVCL